VLDARKGEKGVEDTDGDSARKMRFAMISCPWQMGRLEDYLLVSES